MKFLPIFFSLFSAVTFCLPLETKAQHHDDHESHMAERLEELNSREGDFERDMDERRQNEGEYFDEGMYEVEKQWMQQEIALERDRIEIERSFHKEMRNIDQRWEQLNQERQDYWINRQQDDLSNRRQDFERDMDERRQNEGEHFDEGMYEVEKQWMEKEISIEEKRIAIDKEFNQKRNELQNGPGGQDPNAWQRLDEEQQQRFQQIDREWEQLNQERQDYWEQWEEENHHGDEYHNEGEYDHTDENGPPMGAIGPNSIQALVVSNDGQIVVVEILINESEPISGWGIDISFDPDVLKFQGLGPGPFIPGQIPLPAVDGDLLKAGGAVMGTSDGFSGSGILGKITFKIVGDLPTTLRIQDATVRGDYDQPSIVSEYIEIY